MRECLPETTGTDGVQAAKAAKTIEGGLSEMGHMEVGVRLPERAVIPARQPEITRLQRGGVWLGVGRSRRHRAADAAFMRRSLWVFIVMVALAQMRWKVLAHVVRD